MPVSDAQAKDPALVRALGGLSLSVVRPAVPMLGVRALRWHRDLVRLGVSIPLFVVHDVGLLFAAPREQLTLGPRPVLAQLRARNALPPKFEDYAKLLDEVAASEVSRRAQSLRLSDDLLAVLLARIFSSLALDKNLRDHSTTALPLDPELVRDLDTQLEALFFRAPRDSEARALEAISRSRLHLITMVDSLDLDTLRLLGMLGPESSAAGALGQVDLLSAISSPTANDVVNFSLELLPSILETRRNATTSAFAAHGYAGVGSKGSLDSLVLTELAWDEAEFARRFLDNELLYYSREQSTEEARRLHYIVLDASASMRGERQVFARGLAIALGKKLQLAGEEVWFRFFDSRLYEVQRSKTGQLPIAYLLGFKGERGRNPARVFAQLATELHLLRARDHRDPLVHLITHAALHIPRDVVTELSRACHLSGVFILPSGGSLDLEYLDLLDGHSIVDHTTLSERAARAKAATRIVDDASKRGAAAGPESLRAPVSAR